LATRRSDGQVVLADGASARVRALLNGRVDTLAGGRRAIAADGPGKQVGFGSPRGVAVAPDGSVYVVDAKEHALRHVTGL
jgi:DNA-binding beta-propeller fold protein YncE